MNKSFSAQCGHVKRRLKQNEPLTGDLLTFALECIESENIPDELKDVPNKLKAGTPLTEYEYHLFVEVILLHLRLGAE